jgi:predicted amidohydrolase
MESAEQLRISLVQADIAWEDTHANLMHFDQLLSGLPPTDVVVLPEMFSTAFSSNAQALAEPIDGPTMQQVKQWAAQYQCAFVGSFIACENNLYYNRGFFTEPDGTTHFYDKRHLFFGGEETYFTAGTTPTIVSYKGWNIALSICYDLRFPVWLRNYHLKYDILMVVAEWPTNRQYIFDHLLIARAIENQAYVCACNRIGKDGNHLQYVGGSQVIDYRGKVLKRLTDHTEEVETVVLEKYPLESMREKAPVWKHADAFSWQ